MGLCENPDLQLRELDFLLLGGNQLLEGSVVVGFGGGLLLLLLDRFDERGQKLAIAHVIGAVLVVATQDEG